MEKIRAIHGLIKTELPVAAGICGREFAFRTFVIFVFVSLLTFMPYVYGWFGGFYLISVILLNLGVYFYAFSHEDCISGH